jgi:hypothetical protein
MCGKKKKREALGSRHSRNPRRGELAAAASSEEHAVWSAPISSHYFSLTSDVKSSPYKLLQLSFN